MYLHFKYGKEFIEETHEELNEEIETLTANLSKQKQTLSDQNKEIRRLEDVISNKERDITDTKQVILDCKRNVADAKSTLGEEKKKYEEAEERRDGAQKAVKITKSIPIVNLIAVGFKSHYESQLEEHEQYVQDALDNLLLHQKNLKSKEDDLNTCIKDCGEAKRKQNCLENKIQETKKQLDSKKKEMTEKTDIQVLIRQIFNYATIITGKAKVLKNETKGAYSCDAIQSTLNELINDLNKLSAMKNTPIRGCTIPALGYCEDLRHSLDKDASMWI